MSNNKRILEIGCGQGFNTYLRAKRNDSVIGIDLSKTDVDIAKRRYPDIDFKVMNAEKLKFKDNYFDEVYAIEVLEHVDDIKKVLNEISRVLRSKGRFIASIPYYKSERWLLKIRPSYFKEIHHVRVFKRNELENLCRRENLILTKKRKKGFLQHIELFFLFKRKNKSNSQISIGSWRDNVWTKMIHAIMLYFDPLALETPLKFFPIWVVTIPFGLIINNFGSLFFPKSLYYEFVKK